MLITSSIILWRSFIFYIFFIIRNFSIPFCTIQCFHAFACFVVLYAKVYGILSIAIHCIAIHCIAIHCIAIHCIAFQQFSLDFGNVTFSQKPIGGIFFILG